MFVYNYMLCCFVRIRVIPQYSDKDYAIRHLSEQSDWSDIQVSKGLIISQGNAAEVSLFKLKISLVFPIFAGFKV